jgi:hypothetical protein
MKSAGAQSLRGQVDKWLSPDAAVPIRVTAFGRIYAGGARYVSVEVKSITGLRSLYFFKHSDGSWRVYPPTADRYTAPPSISSRD